MEINAKRGEIAAEVFPVKRVLVVPPAAPGSKGDEGMIRGAMRLFHNIPVTIINPDPDAAWLAHLGVGDARNGTIAEAVGPLPNYTAHLADGDMLFVVGADVIDGTCGVPAAMDRLALMRSAQARGVPVFVNCSFRSKVAMPILEELAWHRGAFFLMRDAHSLDNLRRQTGIEGKLFPDLSFFLEPPRTTAIAQTIHDWLDGLDAGMTPRLGVNFAEHSFRAFSDVHTDAARADFVASVLAALDRAFPSAAYVLVSNDVRTWPNHISDDAFSAMAQDWIARNLGKDRAIIVDPAASYVDNIAILRHLDLVVTGRMHLSFASFRAGTPAAVLMGEGKGYSSIDKMRGAFTTHMGTDLGVVPEIGRLEEVAPRLLSAPEATPRLERFNLTIKAECAAAAAWLAEINRGQRAPSSLTAVAEAQRIAQARQALLVREGLVDRATQATLDAEFASKAELHAARAERDAALAAARSAETMAALAREEAAAALEARAAAEQRAADAEMAPVRHVQGLVEAGDRLAEELRRGSGTGPSPASLPKRASTCRSGRFPPRPAAAASPIAR